MSIRVHASATMLRLAPRTTTVFKSSNKGFNHKTNNTKLLSNTKFITLLFSLIMTLLISSCGSTPIKTIDSEQTSNYELPLESVPAYIDNAKNKIEPEKSRELLLASRILIEYGENDWAINVLGQIDPQFLNYDEKAERILFFGSANMARGDQSRARAYFISQELSDLVPRLSSLLKIHVYEKRATILYDTGEYQASILERIELTGLLSDEFEQQLNQDLIWQSLMEVPKDLLQNESTRQANVIAQGWYSLASISKNNQSNITQQLRDIENWALIWPEHPAARMLPADLLIIKQIAAEQATSVGVLLPLTGRLSKASHAIRDGMMAAYYTSVNQGEFTPQLKFYDTAIGDIGDVYQLAVREGAQAIVGPLSKESITALLNKQITSVTTLTLNQIDRENQRLLHQDEQTTENTLNDNTFLSSQEETLLEGQSNELRNEASADEHLNVLDTDLTAPVLSKQGEIEPIDRQVDPENIKNVYQFSLSLEDEAHQIAEKAWRDGHRRVMMIIPERSSGRRSAEQFKTSWLELGGDIVGEFGFGQQQQYSQLIEDAMQVNESKNRYKTVQQLVGQSIEFEPRRRQDIDFIFLVSRTVEARQLKPILAFHYAQTIPVYSTSDVFNGENQARLNQDMDGIRFPTMPWFFAKEQPEKKSVSSYIGEAGQYQQLYAFGVDAYRLYPRLKKLNQIRQSNFYGETGKLRIGEYQNVVRQQIWAEYRNGLASPLQVSLDVNNAEK